ncbi:MAG: GrpB family protein [Flavobacteriales bacterium]|nr:GrpB family protein [Flavobacteriales bacterium]
MDHVKRPHAPLSDRIAALVKEKVSIVPYDHAWPAAYKAEEERLLRALPPVLVKRIAHIGSTAVPGVSSKPIIDIQVEVTSLDHVQRDVVPIMEDMGYEFIWRPTIGEEAPFYAWFIKRDVLGHRTHHVHMVEPDQASADRLLFRDLLCADPALANKYEALKHDLAKAHSGDRTAYTMGKSDFINSVLRSARTEPA